MLENVLYQPLHTLLSFLKLGRVLLTWPVDNWITVPHLLQATFNSETVLWFRMKFSKKLCHRFSDIISQTIQIWRVKWPYFFTDLRTVNTQALLSALCSVCRAGCISLNLPLRLTAVGCGLQWNLESEINKQL